MVLIRFPTAESKRAALGKLAGRFSFKSWASGEMLLCEEALPYLAAQRIVFTIMGPATYEQTSAAFRGSTSGRLP